jgi:transcriptional regulator with XRE-family HTH domain
MMKTLGEYIRFLRERKDFSLRELAKKLEITPAFLSDVELGRRHPSEEVLANIARLLEKTVEDLREHDTRAPLEAIKRLAASDPSYGLAFRQVVEGKITPQELMDLVKKKQGGKKGA